MSEYLKALKSYENLYKELLTHNIIAYSVLSKSEYFDDFGKISCDLAKAIISIKYKDIEHIEFYSGYSYDDWAQELAIKLTKSFEPTMSAIINAAQEGESHSYSAYVFSSYESLLKDTLKGLKNYYVKKKVAGLDPKTGKKTNRSEYVFEEDENGLKCKAKYAMPSSLDAPLASNDSEHDSFLDKLFETNNSAEDIYFSYAENEASLYNIAKYIFIIGNHKKKGRLLAFMETIFCELGYMKEKQIADMVYKANCASSSVNLVKIYNSLLEYMERVLCLPNKYFHELEVSSLESFEDRMLTPSANIVYDEFSKLRNRYKNELATYLERSSSCKSKAS